MQIIFHSDKIGRIKFDTDSGKLIRVIQIKNEEHHERPLITKEFCYEDNSTASQGYLRKLDLAFAFTFLKLNEIYNFSPFQTIFLDGLENLTVNETNLLFDGIIGHNYKLVVFNFENKLELLKDLYDIKEFEKNDLILTDTATKQTDLKSFFH
jgi:hypothetical protein